MAQRRDDQDRIRYQQKKHQVGMRPPAPAVSARGVRLSPDPSVPSATEEQPTTEPYAQPFDEKDATQPNGGADDAEDDEIDFDATSTAIKDAMRTVGKRFKADSSERSELAKLLGVDIPVGGSSPNAPVLSKLNVGLLLIIIVLCVLLFRQREVTASKK